MPNCSTLNLAPTDSASSASSSESNSDDDRFPSASTDDDTDQGLDISFLSLDMEPPIKVSSGECHVTPGSGRLEMEELELDEPLAPTFSPITTLPSTMDSNGQVSSQSMEQILPDPPQSTSPCPETASEVSSYNFMIHYILALTLTNCVVMCRP